MTPCPRVTSFSPSQLLSRRSVSFTVSFTPPFSRPRQLKIGGPVRLNSTMANEDRIAYNWIRGVETLEEYAPGGYHPIIVGDVLHGRYHIADKLSFGGYSSVWLA